MSHVDMAIRIGRAVMEHIRSVALILQLDFLIHLSFIPGPEHIGLLLGEVRLHGKGRLRKVKRILIILGHRQ